jgi:hypothetical protein
VINYGGVDYNSPYLTVNSVVSYTASLQREKGGLGRSLQLVEHICICLLIPRQPIGKGKKERRGRERVRVMRADPMSFNMHFTEHGNWATPCLS